MEFLFSPGEPDKPFSLSAWGWRGPSPCRPEGLSQMACEGADRLADFPCAAWHRREPTQKGFLLKNKRG